MGTSAAPVDGLNRLTACRAVGFVLGAIARSRPTRRVHSELLGWAAVARAVVGCMDTIVLGLTGYAHISVIREQGVDGVNHTRRHLSKR